VAGDRVWPLRLGHREPGRIPLPEISSDPDPRRQADHGHSPPEVNKLLEEPQYNAVLPKQTVKLSEDATSCTNNAVAVYQAGWSLQISMAKGLIAAVGGQAEENH
jgi:hypothetical protein